VTSWTTREAAEKCGLTLHTVRWYERIGAGLARSGAGEQERLELLQGHRDRVRRALVEQQECLELLDTKIRIYRDKATKATT
jgi:hypothetical protein